MVWAGDIMTPVLLLSRLVNFQGLGLFHLPAARSGKMPGVYGGTCLCGADSKKTTRLTEISKWVPGAKNRHCMEIICQIFNFKIVRCHKHAVRNHPRNYGDYMCLWNGLG